MMLETQPLKDLNSFVGEDNQFSKFSGEPATISISEMDEVTSNESSTPSTTSQQVDPFLDKQVDP
jgi:hypothetical protein